MSSFFPRPPSGKHAALTTWQLDWGMPDWTSGDLRNRAPRPMSIVQSNDNGLEFNYLEVSPNSDPMVSISDDQKSLRLSGILVDTVDIIGQCSDVEGYGIRSEQRVTFKGLCAKARLHLTAFFEAEKLADVASAKIYPNTDEDILTVFGSILLSRYKMKDPVNEMQNFCNWYSSLTWLRTVHAIQYQDHPIIYWLALISAYSFHYVSIIVVQKWPPAWNTMHEYLAFLKRLHEGANGRRLIRTKHGYLGSAPKETQVGNQIALFRGGLAPFVIRKSRQDWDLLGEAYVHRLHDQRLWNADPSPSEDISLN